MSVTISNYPNVRDRTTALQMALSSELAILPRGFADGSGPGGLAHEPDASTVRKLLSAGGLEVQQLEPMAGRLPAVVQHSADWLSPTIFVGSMLLSQNPYAIQVALNIISTYLVDALRGAGRSGLVKVNVVVEQSDRRSCRLLTFEGPASSLSDLERVIHSLQEQ
jgi:hypothetical protein